MRELRFPYIALKGEFYPIIPATLIKGKKAVLTSALVDSGATISLFQGSLGEHLGVKIEAGKKRLFQGVGGKIVGYIHPLTVEVAGLEFPCEIAFSHELTTSLNMFGRKDFFNKFPVCFDEKKKEVILKEK